MCELRIGMNYEKLVVLSLLLWNKIVRVL
jgi:hypothetical protein